MLTNGTSEIRATLWPQRLIAVRRSLNRSSRIIVLLGLLALFGNAFWVWHDFRPGAAAFDPLEFHTWYHPAYVNSILLAIIMLYAMRQISRTREKLMPLGYPLLERESHFRSLEVWRSVEPLTKRPVHLHLIKPERYPADPAQWKTITQYWMRRAEKARRLTSPHIAQIIDCGLAKGNRFYSVIEMPKGIPLFDLIEQYGPFPPDRALFILAQVAHAIEDAHANKLHRLGLHPKNIRIGHRSSNEDWVSLVLFDYENAPEPAQPEEQDIREFTRIAFGIMTGTWINDGAVVDPATLETAMREQAIPYSIRLVMERCLDSEGEGASPPPMELVTRMWQSLSGPAWNNDRAAAWWKEHLEKVAVPS